MAQALPYISSSSSSIQDKVENVDRDIHDLARRFTNQSSNPHYSNPFDAEKDGPLNPNGPNFRARDWAKAFYNVKTAISPAKAAGVAFQRLNVFGYGSTTDYQLSVGNAFLKLPGAIQTLNAVEFCKALRTQADVFDSIACVAIYQAPQAAYGLFDKVLVPFEGRQIYFGKATDAKAYFERIGFRCPDGQTPADFLTSVTSSSERISRPGFENQTPRTPEEFSLRWLYSPDRKNILDQREEYNKERPFAGKTPSSSLF